MQKPVHYPDQFDSACVEGGILKWIGASPRKITSLELIRVFSSKYDISQTAVKRIIRRLLNERKLIYTNEFGRSFLTLSHNLPVRISRRIILSPPKCSVKASLDHVVIRLNSGAAFGEGSHPTTRLALRCLDDFFSDKWAALIKKPMAALDVGTGSGVLAIAAVGLGADSVLGLDTDPSARYEARLNAMENEMDKAVVIDHQPVESLRGSYSLLLANLRYPSLMRYSEKFFDLVQSGGGFIFSGVRRSEAENIMRCYEHLGCKLVRKIEELDWVGLSFEK